MGTARLICQQLGYQNVGYLGNLKSPSKLRNMEVGEMDFAMNYPPTVSNVNCYSDRCSYETTSFCQSYKYYTFIKCECEGGHHSTQVTLRCNPLVEVSDPEITDDIVDVLDPEITDDIVKVSDPEITEDMVDVLDPEITDDMVKVSDPEITDDIVKVSDPEITDDIVKVSDPEITDDIVKVSDPEITDDMVDVLDPGIIDDIVEVSDPEITDDIVEVSDPQTLQSDDTPESAGECDALDKSPECETEEKCSSEHCEKEAVMKPELTDNDKTQEENSKMNREYNYQDILSTKKYPEELSVAPRQDSGVFDDEQVDRTGDIDQAYVRDVSLVHSGVYSTDKSEIVDGEHQTGDSSSDSIVNIVLGVISVTIGIFITLFGIRKRHKIMALFSRRYRVHDVEYEHQYTGVNFGHCDAEETYIESRYVIPGSSTMESTLWKSVHEQGTCDI